MYAGCDHSVTNYSEMFAGNRHVRPTNVYCSGIVTESQQQRERGRAVEAAFAGVFRQHRSYNSLSYEVGTFGIHWPGRCGAVQLADSSHLFKKRSTTVWSGGKNLHSDLTSFVLRCLHASFNVLLHALDVTHPSITYLLHNN